MIVRGPTVATLAAGLTTIVGYGDTLGTLTIISYVTKAKQPNNAALGVVGFVVTIIGPALMLVVAFVSGVVAGSRIGHWAGDRRRQAVLRSLRFCLPLLRSWMAYRQLARDSY